MENELIVETVGFAEDEGDAVGGEVLGEGGLGGDGTDGFGVVHECSLQCDSWLGSAADVAVICYVVGVMVWEV
jgi:hypothetical protein